MELPGEAAGYFLGDFEEKVKITITLPYDRDLSLCGLLGLI